MPAPHSRRSRVVTLARAGTAGSDSVNDPRGQPCSRHRQRRFHHTSSTGVSPYGMSRGRVDRAALYRRRDHPAGRARRRGLVRGDQVRDAGPVLPEGDSLDRESFDSQQ
jgi:hypothetical protein